MFNLSPSLTLRGMTLYLDVLRTNFRFVLLILHQSQLRPILLTISPWSHVHLLLPFSREESVSDWAIHSQVTMYALVTVADRSDWISVFRDTRAFQVSMLASACTPLQIVDFCTCSYPTLDLPLTFVWSRLSHLPGKAISSPIYNMRGFLRLDQGQIENMLGHIQSSVSHCFSLV